MSGGRGAILVAEDQEGMRTFLAAALEDAGFGVSVVADGLAAIRALDEREFDVVLTDLRMPGADGMAVLAKARAAQPEASVIVLTAFGTIDRAVEAMRAGAADFLTKPVDSPEVLVMAVERALSERRLRADNERLRREEPPAVAFDDIVQVDPRTREVVRLAKAVAPTPSTVLLLGESGTGKEVFARAIHELGSPGRPFVAVNCAAIPRELLESELFGHERGAFTGATSRHQGRFELAGDGTLFLDEVGELELALQAKLLRVIQEGTFQRVGGTRVLRFGGRLLAATNRDLRESIRRGAFREDLYYRLAVFPLEIPPLRERPADILPLARHLLTRLASRTAGRPLEIDDAAAGVLSAYGWPGNIRELANVLERATILAPSGRLTLDLLPAEVRAAPRREGEPEDGGSLRELERQAILEALEATSGNRRKAAEQLGISLRTLQSRLRDYGLTRR
jgi:two-component system, NtrC family, response regulator AtoC